MAAVRHDWNQMKPATAIVCAFLVAYEVAP
jgi:hypothetical protein